MKWRKAKIAIDARENMAINCSTLLGHAPSLIHGGGKRWADPVPIEAQTTSKKPNGVGEVYAFLKTQNAGSFIETTRNNETTTTRRNNGNKNNKHNKNKLLMSIWLYYFPIWYFPISLLPISPFGISPMEFAQLVNHDTLILFRQTVFRPIKYRFALSILQFWA